MKHFYLIWEETSTEPRNWPQSLDMGFKLTNYYTLSIQKCLVILGLNATLCDYGTNTLMATESLEKNSEDLWLASLLNDRSVLQ